MFHSKTYPSMAIRNPQTPGAEVIVLYMFRQAVPPLIGKALTLPREIPRKVEGKPKAMEGSRAEIRQVRREMEEEESHQGARREAMEDVHQTLRMVAEVEVDRFPQMVVEAENLQTRRMEAAEAEAHQNPQEAEMAICWKIRNNHNIHQSPLTTRKSAQC